MRTALRWTLPLLIAVLAVTLLATPAGANRRQDAMSWALRRIGCPYEWSGLGPCHSRGFDCSGLVVAAYASEGIHLPRTTYEMLASSMLVPQLGHPRPGNLVFFGSGHVTLYFWRHVVLQAPQPGENVQLTRWYPGSGWVPTGYYRVRDAGGGPMQGLARWARAEVRTLHLTVHGPGNLRDVSLSGRSH